MTQFIHSTKQQFDLGQYIDLETNNQGIMTLKITNLLKNSSFSNDCDSAESCHYHTGRATYWGVWLPGGSLDTYIPSLDYITYIDGYNSQKIIFTSNTGNELFFGQDVLDILPNTNYTLSVDIKIDDPTNVEAKLYFDFWIDNKTYVGNASSIYSSPITFTRLSLTTIIPATANSLRAWIILRPKATATLPVTGTIWVDAAQLEIGNIATTYTTKYNVNSGQYVSPIFDLSTNKNLHKLEMTTSVPYSVNTSIQMRSADTISDISTSLWYGPTNQSDYYYHYDYSTNLLLNSGFEIQNTINPNMPNNWSTYNTGTTQIYTYPESGRIGGSSIAIEYTVIESGKVALWGQSMTIDPNKKYKLSGWIKTSNIIGGGIYGGAAIYVDWKTSIGTYISRSSIMTRQTGTIDWTYFEGIITPISNSIMSTIVLSLYDSSGKVWFDDISFSEVLISKEWPVNQIHKNNQYIQYKIDFDTIDKNYSPMLYDVRINYGTSVPEIRKIDVSSDTRGLSYAFYPGENVSFNIEIVEYTGIGNISNVKIDIYNNIDQLYNTINLSPGTIVDTFIRQYIGSFILPSFSDINNPIGTWEARITVTNISNQYIEPIFIKVRNDYTNPPQRMILGIEEGYCWYPTSVLPLINKWYGLDIIKFGMFWNHIQPTRIEFKDLYVTDLIKLLDEAQINNIKIQLMLCWSQFPDWVNNGVAGSKGDDGGRYTNYIINRYITEFWIRLVDRIKYHPAIQSYLIMAEENYISDADTYIKSNNRIISAIRNIDRTKDINGNYLHEITIRPANPTHYIRTMVAQNGNQDCEYGSGGYPTSWAWYWNHYASPISQTSLLGFNRSSPIVRKGIAGIGEIGFPKSTYLNGILDTFGDNEKLIAFKRYLAISYELGFDRFLMWEGYFSFKDPITYLPKLIEFRNSLIDKPRLTRFNVRVLSDNNDNIRKQIPTESNPELDMVNEPYYHLARYLDENGYSWFFTTSQAEPLQSNIYDVTILLSEIKDKTNVDQDILISLRLAGIQPTGNKYPWDTGEVIFVCTTLDMNMILI